MLIIRNN